MENLEKASTTKVTVYACEEKELLQTLAVIERSKNIDPSILRSAHILCLGLKSLCVLARNDTGPPLDSAEEASVKKIETFLDYLFKDSVFSNSVAKND